MSSYTFNNDVKITGALTLPTALTVANGGIGTNTLTSTAVLLGNGTSAIQASAMTYASSTLSLPKISLSDTTDALSSSSGGAFTSSGGGAFALKLYVGTGGLHCSTGSGNGITIASSAIYEDTGSLKLLSSGANGISIATSTGIATIPGVIASNLDASKAVFSDGSSKLVSRDTIGTGDVVLASGPTISNLNAGGTKITNLLTPSADTDAATKLYVDNVAQGLDVHASVRVATTDPGTLATSFENGDTIDGVAIQSTWRILIKDQADPKENGIYIVNASGAPSRASDFAIGALAAGAFVFVEQGTANADSGWVCTTNQPTDVVNTNDLAFAQFSSGAILGGAGLTRTGNTLDVDANQTGVITTLGTITISEITTLTTDLSVANGGTGASSFTAGQLLYGDTANPIATSSSLTFASNTLTSPKLLLNGGPDQLTVSNSADYGATLYLSATGRGASR